MRIKHKNNKYSVKDVKAILGDILKSLDKVDDNDSILIWVTKGRIESAVDTFEDTRFEEGTVQFEHGYSHNLIFF